MYNQREPDTSATGHFGTKTLRHHKIGAEMSGHYIKCIVMYSGIWTPVFTCADHLPGTTINQTSSDHVLYTRLIAASNIEDFTQLSCSMSFTLITNYQPISPDIPSEPETPVYDFAWNTSAIRVVNASGK